ncbi:hypothetical protein VFPFJ_07200 [Purpureocillium lilacinum]|nr:hypothetical protein VFPFJ_07200 [Purpureocillium lilacinum]OAQ88735.1 hypothetical protein VFPFJ_07200 [Purpureocillium lilacinum]
MALLPSPLLPDPRCCRCVATGRGAGESRRSRTMAGEPAKTRQQFLRLDDIQLAITDKDATKREFPLRSKKKKQKNQATQGHEKKAAIRGASRRWTRQAQPTATATTTARGRRSHAVPPCFHTQKGHAQKGHKSMCSVAPASPVPAPPTPSPPRAHGHQQRQGLQGWRGWRGCASIRSRRHSRAGPRALARDPTQHDAVPAVIARYDHAAAGAPLPIRRARQAYAGLPKAPQGCCPPPAAACAHHTARESSGTTVSRSTPSKSSLAAQPPSLGLGPVAGVRRAARVR